MTPVLRVQDVRFVRDGRALLDDVSLTVNASGHWALVGATGSGKSTLLSLAGAYRHLTGGVVEILGHRHSAGPTSVRCARCSARMTGLLARRSARVS